MVNVIAGPLIGLGLIPNTAIFLLIFIIPILFLHGLKIDRYIISLLLFSLYIFGIGIYKAANPSAIYIYLKYVIYPLLTYYIVKSTVSLTNYKKVLKVCLIVGIVQLPIVIAQFLFYESLIRFSVIPIVHKDFMTGTFWIQSDPCLSYFALSMIIYLLVFKPFSFRLVLIIIFGFAAIIIVSNSTILKIAMLFVLIVFINIYFGKKRTYGNKKTLLSMGCFNFAIITGILFILFTDSGSAIIQAVGDTYRSQISSGTIERFYAGSYSRLGAIKDILFSPIKLLGDGLTKYFDHDSLIYYRGVHGHLFLYYNELGLLGLILSYYVIWANFRAYSKGIDACGLLIFSGFLLLTLVMRPLEQISILLTFNLFLRLNYLSRLKQARNMGGTRYG